MYFTEKHKNILSRLLSGKILSLKEDGFIRRYHIPGEIEVREPTVFSLLKRGFIQNIADRAYIITEQGKEVLKNREVY